MEFVLSLSSFDFGVDYAYPCATATDKLGAHFVCYPLQTEGFGNRNPRRDGTDAARSDFRAALHGKTRTKVELTPVTECRIVFLQWI
jgi:hypothetical protein